MAGRIPRIRKLPRQLTWLEPWNRAPIQENSELKRLPIQPKVDDRRFPNHDWSDTWALGEVGDEVGAAFVAGDAAARAMTDAAESFGTDRTAGPDTAEIIALASFADWLSSSPPHALSRWRTLPG